MCPLEIQLGCEMRLKGCKAYPASGKIQGAGLDWCQANQGDWCGKCQHRMKVGNQKADKRACETSKGKSRI
jgi:hypothetical protein